MTTRREILTGSALAGLVSMLPTITFSQVAPAPALPVVSVSPDNPVFGVRTPIMGQAIVIGAMVYIVRGMIGTQVIAFLYGRQATLLEFLLWPLPTPAPTPAEIEYLRLALRLGNLPRFREEIAFRIADGRSVEWPVDANAMRTAIKFYSRR